MKRATRPKTIDADQAKRVAIAYCLLHYPTLYTAGPPRKEKTGWRVPVMLEDPDAHISAAIGELQLDPRTGMVTTAPSLADVIAAGRRAYQEATHASATASSPGRK
ncbi:hypothetical protein AYO44_01500 [Planctomycetaceae bacterium SCGC AG-212-F19]|nr:hypothetical protein AYO44_01500 [Planctomycetaceae bacterium SCGC AG-212-F19]